MVNNTSKLRRDLTNPSQGASEIYFHRSKTKLFNSVDRFSDRSWWDIFDLLIKIYKIAVGTLGLIKKTCKKILKNLIFHLKYIFINKKMFLIYNRADFDRSEKDIFNKTIIIWSFPFSQKLWWKTAESCLNCYSAEKHIVSKLSKILI